MDSLRRLASELAIPERTLRRAAGEGLIRGERISARRFRTSLREEMYLRSHWPVLRTLRAGLRTEPNVRLAVLFGSVAGGSDHKRSDIDVLVSMRDESITRVADLAERLSARSGRDVQVVRLSDAMASRPLLADVLDRGRVLVDRDRRWPELRSQTQRWQQRADRPAADTMDDLLSASEDLA